MPNSEGMTDSPATRGLSTPTGTRRWSHAPRPIPRVHRSSRPTSPLRPQQHASRGIGVQDLRPLRGRSSGSILDPDALPDAAPSRRRTARRKINKQERGLTGPSPSGMTCGSAFTIRLEMLKVGPEHAVVGLGPATLQLECGYRSAHALARSTIRSAAAPRATGPPCSPAQRCPASWVRRLSRRRLSASRSRGSSGRGAMSSSAWAGQANAKQTVRPCADHHSPATAGSAGQWSGPVVPRWIMPPQPAAMT